MKYRYIDTKGKNYIIDLFDNPVCLFLFPFTHVYKTKIYQVSNNNFESKGSNKEKHNILEFTFMMLGMIVYRLFDFWNTVFVELSTLEVVSILFLMINILFFGLRFLARKDKWRQKIVNEGYACFKINNSLVVFGEIIAVLFVLYTLKETIKFLKALSINSLFFGVFCAFLIILFPSILLIFAEGIYNEEKLKQKTWEENKK